MTSLIRDWKKKRQLSCWLTQRLLEVSGKMQGQLQQDLNRTASDVISSVTGGKYTRLITEEDLRLSFLCEGRKIPAEHVSAGTLEQVYFALRMAAANLLYEEVYPVVLDDTFAFYDESRLKNNTAMAGAAGQADPDLYLSETGGRDPAT